MTLRFLVILAAIGVIPVSAAAQARQVYRSYVTQIEVNSVTKRVRVWLAPWKGIKGRRDVELNTSDPFFKYTLDLARDSLKYRLPVKVFVDSNNNATALFLRLYPSKRQIAP